MQGVLQPLDRLLSSLRVHGLDNGDLLLLSVLALLYTEHADEETLFALALLLLL